MSRRQRQRRRRANGHGLQKALLVGVGALGAAATIGVLAFIGYILGIAASAPNIDTLKPVDHGATSVVYAAGGQRLGFISSDELRTPVPGTRIPKTVKQATVAIEDQRFYHHHGVDYEGLVRAAFKNLTSGKTLQGGSTITMQLVRNLYISNKRTFARKIKEAKLAEELEHKHDKSWILDSYLNNVDYGTVGGQTAIGIEAGARVFFDKDVRQLTLPEAALLAGMPQAPSVYNPFLRPGDARARRDAVLSRMAKLRYITPSQAVAARQAPLGVKPNRYYTSRREGFFFDYVKQQLIDRYGLNTVRKGGLKIYTTLQLHLQKAARHAMAGQLPYPGDPSSAIVSIDPRNGDIRAMASSASYRKEKFNYAAQGHRQAGSTFKVMVLMTALRRGVDPNTTTYSSHPLDLNTPYGPWKVQTYSHTYGGRMNLVQATVASDNTVYAQLDLDMGPDAVRQTAYDMGITTHLDAIPAEGLGGLRLGVSPLEMADAYATVFSGGIRHRPIAIRKVVFPDGKSEDLGKPKGHRVFPAGVAAEAVKILEKNVQAGTGTAANYGCPEAGKTGTVDNFTDAWFIGGIPNLTTAVWVGYPSRKVPMTSVHGIPVAGGTFPAAIWHDYMSSIHTTCSQFPFFDARSSLQPFFGQYAQTGSTSDRNYKSTTKGAKKYETTGRGGGGGQSGGGRHYDPALYEAPPQPPPKIETPPSGGGHKGGGGNKGGGGKSGGTGKTKQ